MDYIYINKTNIIFARYTDFSFLVRTLPLFLIFEFCSKCQIKNHFSTLISSAFKNVAS